MPTSNIGKPLRNWTIVWHDGMPTSKSMISSSNTSLERSTPQQMNYHVHSTLTRAKTTTKIKLSLNQNSSLMPPTYQQSLSHQKEISWPSSTITPQPDTQDTMKQSEKLQRYYHGLGCTNGYWTTLKDAWSVSRTKSLLIGLKYCSIKSWQKKAPSPFNKLQWISLQDFRSIMDTMPS